MNYTESPQYAVHPGTGHRLHSADQPLPTALSAEDINQLTWSLMEVVLAGGQAPASFNPNDPSTYRILRDALDATYAKLADVLRPGQICLFLRTTAPPGYLKANGATVSRVVYSGLHAEIGETYGAGDGVSTFRLPDFRGEFLRCLDDGRGVDSGRAIGTWQPSWSNGLAQVEMQNIGGAPSLVNVPSDGSWSDWIVSGDEGAGPNWSHRFRSYGSETLVRNFPVLACIKY